MDWREDASASKVVVKERTTYQFPDLGSGSAGGKDAADPRAQLPTAGRDRAEHSKKPTKGSCSNCPTCPTLLLPELRV